MRESPPADGAISTCPTVCEASPASQENDCETAGCSVGVRITRVGGATTGVPGADASTRVSDDMSKKMSELVSRSWNSDTAMVFVPSCSRSPSALNVLVSGLPLPSPAYSTFTVSVMRPST